MQQCLSFGGEAFGWRQARIGGGVRDRGLAGSVEQILTHRRCESRQPGA